MDHGRQVAMSELDRRKVDGDLERLRPGRSFPAGFAQDPFTNGDDKTAVLRDRDERIRRNQSSRRMAPTDQGLEANNLAADKRLRLVVQDELVVYERRLQISLQRASFAQLLVHIGLEESDGAASFRLRPIESGVRVAQERRSIDAVVGIDRNADAQADPKFLSANVEILDECGDQS